MRLFGQMWVVLRHRLHLAWVAMAVWACVAGAASAQVVAETLVENHGTVQNYSTSYTPGTGSDRVIIAVVSSEYISANSSTPNRVRLGGTRMTRLGTQQNSANKKNRLSIFYMPEADIPAGTSTFDIRYGPDGSASMIYLATIADVDQADLSSTPIAFQNNCSSTIPPVNRAGTIDFPAITPDPGDYLFSWIATGENGSTATFNNGGTEFLDTVTFNPGFSLAGALQSPLTSAPISGDADITEGCANRPITAQFSLTPLDRSTDATLVASEEISTNTSVLISVTDGDRNIRATAVDTIEVTVVNLRTGESETIILTETSATSGIFEATLPTTVSASPGADDDGTMVAQHDDVLESRYLDALRPSGSALTLTDTTRVVGQGVLSAQKTVQSATSGSDFHIPGSDVIYTITVTNSGDGPIDDGLFLIDRLPAEITFFNGDPIPSDGDTNPVLFQDNASGLAFAAATSVGYATGPAVPTQMSECTDTPSQALDTAIRFICFAPSGEMDWGIPTTDFSVSFRARIE